MCGCEEGRLWEALSKCWCFFLGAINKVRLSRRLYGACAAHAPRVSVSGLQKKPWHLRPHPSSLSQLKAMVTWIEHNSNQAGSTVGFRLCRYILSFCNSRVSKLSYFFFKVKYEFKRKNIYIYIYQNNITSKSTRNVDFVNGQT